MAIAIGEPEGTPPAPSPQLPTQQLAAVRAVFGTDRLATECDILITTLLEALKNGDRSTDSVVDSVDRVWPGAGVNSTRVARALRIAEAAGYAREVNGSEWSLTSLGRAELTESRDWASDTLERTKTQLMARAAEGFRAISEEEATLWLGVLTTALFEGIRSSYTPFDGKVELLADGTLVPRTYDVERMFLEVASRTPRDEVQDFLNAAILAAIDPSSDFGNELITRISTGYMLHAFLARRDRIRARNAMGNLEGERAILDTPVLFPLLGGADQTTATENAIKAAVDAGMDVVVANHTLEELNDVVERLEREEVPQIEEALTGGANLEVLRQVVDEPVLELWLQARGEGRYRGWEDFRETAGNLSQRLEEFGVKLRPAWNEIAGDSDEVIRFEAALSEVLEDRGTSQRGALQIERDAQTMAMAARTRRKRGYAGGGYWSGGWVVTTDRAMGPAYKRLSHDAISLTITPSQWLGLVSIWCKPAEVEELAMAAAAFLGRETFLSVAAKFPPAVAVEIASALSEDPGTSDTDIRIAQMPLDGLLEGYPDFASDPARAGSQIVAAVLAKRAKRTSAAVEFGLRSVSAERSRSEALVKEATNRLKTEREARERAEKALAEAQFQLLTSEAAIADATRSSRRKAAAYAIAAFLVTMGGVFAFLGLRWIGAGTILTGLFLWERSHRWIREPDLGWSHLMIALIPEVMAIPQFFQSLHN
jgi:hypothetical protein